MNVCKMGCTVQYVGLEGRCHGMGLRGADTSRGVTRVTCDMDQWTDQWDRDDEHGINVWCLF